MTNLDNAVDSILPAIAARRHTDHPKLWLSVILGAIGFHALLLAVSFPVIVHVSPQSHSPSIPIDLVELPPTDPIASAPAAVSPPPTAIPPVSSEPGSNATTFFDPSNSNIPPGAGIERSPESPPPQDTTPSPIDQPASRPGSAPIRPLPQQTPRTGSTSEPSNPLPDSAPVPTEPPQLPQEPPFTSPPRPSLVPDPPEGAGSGSAEGDSLPTVPIAPDVTPASVTARLGSPSLVASDQSYDIPDQTAIPIAPTQTFVSDPLQANCTITPDILRYLGETVQLQVWVKADGTVVDAWLADNRTASTPYTDFAICLLKNWRFSPAISGGAPVDSDNLVVPITIQQ